MKLRAMAVEMPVVAKHPNRVAFEGVLTFVDVASDRAPSGANGHKVILARDAVTDALSYLPLVTVAPGTLPLVSVQGRLTKPRRGEIPYPELGEIAYAFSLPGTWTAIDPTMIDFVADTGELTLPYNLLGLAYGEIEVTYTAGLAVIPAAVQVACAQIVKNAQATPGFNVQRSKIDTIQMQYFSGSVVDPQVQMLLAPYVATRLG